MIIKPIQSHLKQLCKQLGSEYRIILWDLEYVITRDFDNGFSVEISGLNSRSTKKPAQIYLWDLRDDSINQYGYRNGGYIAAKFIIPQDELAYGVEWIHDITVALLGTDSRCGSSSSGVCGSGCRKQQFCGRIYNHIRTAERTGSHK